MIKNNSHFIEDYLDGKLSKSEIKDLLKKKNADQDFADEFDLRKEINETLIDHDLNDLRSKLNRQTNRTIKLYPFGNIGREAIKTWHLAAASFALVIASGGLWYILSNGSMSTDKLVSKYYEPATPLKQYRSVEKPSNDLMQDAFDFYKQSDYENALIYFSQLENQITGKFYSGICYIELNNYDQAINSFKYVVNDNDNLLIEPAEWYLGLIYLMNNQKDNAIVQLTGISESKSIYAEKAKEVLKYIK
jgi:tetratricopeptide (TPR) repeat protein